MKSIFILALLIVSVLVISGCAQHGQQPVSSPTATYSPTEATSPVQTPSAQQSSPAVANADTKSADDDAGYGVDAPNYHKLSDLDDKGLKLYPGKTYTGYLDPAAGDDSDIYDVVIPAGKTVAVYVDKHKIAVSISKALTPDVELVPFTDSDTEVTYKNGGSKEGEIAIKVVSLDKVSYTLNITEK